MAYVVPTPAELKAMFPEFSTVDDATVQIHIELASRMVDESWTEGDFKNAIIFLACHFMALNGIGTGPDSVANASNMSVYQTIRSGALTLSRGSSSGDLDMFGFKASRYGRLFLMLLRLNRSGPRVTGCGEIGGGRSPYAKDTPLWSVYGKGR